MAVFFCAAGFLFLCKDRIALWLIQKNFHKALPQYALDVRGVSLSLSSWSLSIGRFDIRKKTGSPAFALKGGRLFMACSPMLMRRDFLPFLKKVDVEVARLDQGDVTVENVSLSIGPRDEMDFFPVKIRVTEIMQGKKDIKYISGQGRISKESFILQKMRASLCGGSLEAKAEGSGSGASARAVVHLFFNKIRMDELIKELELEKKVDLTGVFSGPVDFSVGFNALTDLKGQLDSQGGGRLVIVDNGSLQQSLGAGNAANLVVENLKNYDYDIGKVIIGKEGESLKAEISLEGAGGRRHLEVYWHGEAESQR